VTTATESATTERPFWARPRWVVGHVLAIVLVVAFVNLGFWQLRRHDERRERNAAVETRSALPVVPVADVVDAEAGFDEVGEVVYRRVTARGRYDPGGEVLIRSRSLGGQPGYHVVTPLVTAQGPALAVNRGFLPLAEDDAGAPSPASGEVEVEGLLLPTQERGRLGPRDPDEGRLRQLARLDLGRLQQQYGTDLYPLHLQLQRQDPPPGELPVLLPETERDAGPHLGYAFQWFAFATIGTVGWVVLLRRTARSQPA
jgi:surfeit locus 1 family protein